MANESKKDFNVMMNNNKDMPKIQIVEDEKSTKGKTYNCQCYERLSSKDK